MERRTAAKVAVSVVVIVAVVAAAFAHPVSPSPAERGFFGVPNVSNVPDDADGHRLTASINSDTGNGLGIEGVVVKGGARYGVLTDDDQTTTAIYQPSPDGVVYERTVAGEDRAERRLENAREDNATELLWYENDTDGTTIVSVDSDEGDIAEEIEGSASMYINNLYVVEYDRTDRNGGEIYEPHGGWFEGFGTYHATDVSGEVRTTDGAVRHANVSWRSWRVENYAYYVLAKLFTDKPERTRTAIEFEAVEDGAETPDWVKRARDERSS
ncbi:MAG: hypothetical protein ACLFSW_05470 [Halobacteriales archaeon]